MEVGNVATSFERRTIGEELRLCQRYYEIKQSTGVGSHPWGSTHSYFTWFFKVQKRVTPTITEGAGTVKSSTHHTDIDEYSINRLSTNAQLGAGTTADAEF